MKLPKQALTFALLGGIFLDFSPHTLAADGLLPLQVLIRPKSRVIDERDLHPSQRLTKINPHSCAIVLIGVFDPEMRLRFQGRVNKLMQEKINPLLFLAGKHNIPVYYVKGQRTDHRLPPKEVQAVAGTDALYRALVKKGVHTLIYAGFPSNGELLVGPGGIQEMKTQCDTALQMILLRDCSMAYELPESRSGEWFHYSAVLETELKWGASTTLANLSHTLSKQL